MDMTLYDKGKEAGEMTYTLHFSVDEETVQWYRKGTMNSDEGTMPMESTIIMDNSNKCMIMLTNVGGQKMAMISSLDAEAAESECWKPEMLRSPKQEGQKLLSAINAMSTRLKRIRPYRLSGSQRI